MKKSRRRRVARQLRILFRASLHVEPRRSPECANAIRGLVVECVKSDLLDYSLKSVVMKRSHTTDSAADGKKKTRFVAPEDDPARFDEHVADQLETARDTAKGRRGKVRTEGYESDSSDEGESVVRSRAKNAKGAQDEDDDMFAMGEKAAAKEEDGTASGKKEEKYLRLGDIEGQEFGNDASGSGGERGLGSEASEEDSESESEGEPEDEDDAERRAKAGMGFELSSFNMREEMEEGKFTEDGSFVRTFDPHAAHDRWLEGTDEREMKKARRAQRAKAKAERERRRKEAKEEKEGGGKEDIVIEMLGLLKRGETVLEALARLGEKTKKTKGKENGYAPCRESSYYLLTFSTQCKETSQNPR